MVIKYYSSWLNNKTGIGEVKRTYQTKGSELVCEYTRIRGPAKQNKPKQYWRVTWTIEAARKQRRAAHKHHLISYFYGINVLGIYSRN